MANQNSATANRARFKRDNGKRADRGTSQQGNGNEDDVQAEAADVFSNEEDGNDRSLEDEMRDLQANLGDDWILRVCIQGEHAWLTAEKDDGTQRVEAPAAHALAEVVDLLKERGGRRASASRGKR